MKKVIIASVCLLMLSACTRPDFKGSITVSGKGSVFASPDTASLSISIEEYAPTTKEAQELTNRKMQEVIAALKAAGIEERAIQTSRIVFDKLQEWHESTRKYVILGQRVRQSLVVKFENLESNPRLLAATLDVLGSVDGIQIGNLGFSMKDTTSHYVEARKLAFAKAMQKAQELATYADVKLGKAITIDENQGSAGYPMVQSNVARSYEASDMDNTELPGGEIEISVALDVVFETH